MTKKVLTKSAIIFLVFFIVLLIFIPLAVRKITIKNSKQWIGRSIALEKLKVNYFNGTVSLLDFKMFEADDTAVFVSFDTLVINTIPYKLISNEIVVEQLYLKGLNINIALSDSSFNFDDLIEFHRPDSVLPDTTLSEPLRFELSNLELNDAFFTARDLTLDKQMELNNIDFYVPYISWDQEHKSEAGLRFDFKNGGYFQSSLDIHPNSGEFEADIILNGLGLVGYDEFVAKYIDVGSFEGTTDIEVVLTGNINNPEHTLISGNFGLSDFKLEDHQEKPLFGVDALRVKVEEIDLAEKQFIIDSVILHGPSVHFEMEDSVNNISTYIENLLPAQDSIVTKNEIEVKSADDSIIYYAINSFLIQNGSCDIVDNRTGEPFLYHLSEMSLSCDSITSQSNWITADANMLLNNRGKLIAQVGINPTDPMNVNIDYTISDFMLSDLNIYSRHYMGFPILYGDMYYKAHTEIVDGQISSENKLIIHNVELGSKGGGIYNLPLKFALFLLKDKDGVINLDIPVSGDLKDPKVSIGKIVWNTFKNLIVKAAAAPVKLLSGLVGADPHDIEYIEYDFMDTVFTDHKKRQLELLQQLEMQKPDLEIELVYFKDPELEKKEIAHKIIGENFNQKYSGKDYQQDKDDFEEYVKGQTEIDTMSIAEACLLLIDEAEVDSISLSYDQQRITDLSNYLTSARDSTEILVLRSKASAPKNYGSKPLFEVKYGMKEEHLE